MRHLNKVDQLISRFDKTLYALSSSAKEPKLSSVPEVETLSEQDRQCSLALMRINHCGEVCAQSLYLGQALLARHTKLANQLYISAEEERGHLTWCASRIAELKGQTSLLTPVFALGSLGIGILAGLSGDKWSLGFLAETEDQVTRHLDGHLKQLPRKDRKSQMILEKMREDELQHKTKALEQGGRPLPGFIRFLMSMSSRIMTISTRYL